MKNKKGVSLVILIMTIIVMVVLASTVTLQVVSTARNERLSVFVNNLIVIEEYMDSCNILKEDLPYTEELTLAQVKNLVGSTNLSKFNEELNKRGDASTAVFKKIDVSKIGIRKEFYGREEKGANDIFVYSEATGTAYYLLGVDYKGVMYFCINEDVTSFVK